MATDPITEAFFEVEAVEPPQHETAPAGAARTFRHYDQHQSFLLPVVSENSISLLTRDFAK